MYGKQAAGIHVKSAQSSRKTSRLEDLRTNKLYVYHVILQDNTPLVLPASRKINSTPSCRGSCDGGWEVGEGGYDASALDLRTRVNNTCMSGWSKINMCVPSQSNMGKRVSFGWDRADNFPVHPLPQTTFILTGFRLQEDRPSSNKSVSIVQRSCLGREEVKRGEQEHHYKPG